MNAFQILHQLIHRFKLKEERQLEQTGLSGRDLYVLEHIREDNPWRFNDFAENYRIRPSTLTGIVERLEKKKLLLRERATDDRKAVYLKPTPAGKQLIDEHIAEDHAFFDALLTSLTPAEQQQFLSLCQKITATKKHNGPSSG